MEKASHKIGPWYVNDGSMYNRTSGSMLDEDISIILMIDKADDVGILHKVGKTEPLRKYVESKAEKLKSSGHDEMEDEFLLLTFNVKNELFGFKPDGYNLDIDDVCTLVNWFNNGMVENISGFLSLSGDEIMTKINSLQNIGF